MLVIEFAGETEFRVGSSGVINGSEGFVLAIGGSSCAVALPLITPASPTSCFQASRPPIRRTGGRFTEILKSVSNIACARFDMAGVELVDDLSYITIKSNLPRLVNNVFSVDGETTRAFSIDVDVILQEFVSCCYQTGTKEWWSVLITSENIWFKTHNLITSNPLCIEFGSRPYIHVEHSPCRILLPIFVQQTRLYRVRNW